MSSLTPIGIYPANPHPLLVPMTPMGQYPDEIHPDLMYGPHLPSFSDDEAESNRESYGPHLPAYSAPATTPVGPTLDPEALLPMIIESPRGEIIVPAAIVAIEELKETYDPAKINKAKKRLAEITEEIKDRVNKQSKLTKVLDAVAESTPEPAPTVVIVERHHHHHHGRRHTTHHPRSHSPERSDKSDKANVAGRVAAGAAGGAILLGTLYFIGRDIRNFMTASEGLIATMKLSLVLRQNSKQHTPRDQNLEEAAQIRNKSIRLFGPMMASSLIGLSVKAALAAGCVLLIAGGMTGMVPLMIAGGVVTVVALGAIALQWGIEFNQKRSQARKAEAIFNLASAE